MRSGKDCSRKWPLLTASKICFELSDVVLPKHAKRCSSEASRAEQREFRKRAHQKRILRTFKQSIFETCTCGSYGIQVISLDIMNKGCRMLSPTF